jgi:SAM-dependent methyltransferase
MPTPTTDIDLWSHIQNERPALFGGAKGRLDALLRLAARQTKGRFLLNIGCGDGYLEQAAQKKNWRVVSVDPDSKSAEKLKSAGIDARCGVIESLPVESGSIHAVICTEVLEHLTPDSMESGLKEIQRVLAPGGVLIGTVPYRENLADNEVFCPDCKKSFHRWGHQQSFDETRMRTVLARYFGPVQARPIYFASWRSLNWKGTLLWSARYAFSVFGIYGMDANLLFIANKAK